MLAALETDEAALPVLPVVDTLKRAEGEHLVAGPDRQGLARAQTPQGFRFAPILAAHRAAAGRELTDDAAVAEAAGIPVRRVEGEERNLKVTTPDDLTLAGLLLAGAPRAYRTGMGYDVHAFAEGRPMVLCGVRIPHERGLLGHSDADAALHAVTDALLGTIGAGDIGQHFPPSDERWRDCDSGVFLRHAARSGRDAGRPDRERRPRDRLRAAEDRPAPRGDDGRLADLLGVAPGRVGIKATTSERMGFTGRGEGLVAQAVATVSFPAEVGDGAVPDCLTRSRPAAARGLRGGGPAAGDGRVLHRRADRRLPDRDRRLIDGRRPRLCRLRQPRQGRDAGRPRPRPCASTGR